MVYLYLPTPVRNTETRAMLLNVVIHTILLVGLASGCQRCSAAASKTSQMLGWYPVAEASLHFHTGSKLLETAAS